MGLKTTVAVDAITHVPIDFTHSYNNEHESRMLLKLNLDNNNKNFNIKWQQ
jgi:hypothetical protein